MRTPSTVVEIKKAIRQVAKTLGVRKAVLFGSFARGTESRRSDVDVVFIADTEERFVERSDVYLKMMDELIDGRAVDVLVYTPDEFERMADRPFIAQILREGKVVYES